ncbi:MAG TPA: DUF5690 family protein [Kofleriaceae bacterium]|nr:DUF5690 family protein [Kofleriaceae bacterium]
MIGAGHQGRISRALARAPTWALTAFAVTCAFSAYFCMYSYRKPFAAAAWTGPTIGPLSLKDALIIGQLCGYALSKCAGIRFNSEMPPARRATWLLVLIVFAEAALVVFAVVGPRAKVVAMIINGLPLGAVWGLVFSFLEGRRTSEILGAGLSCSYIVASGAVKSAGAALVGHGIPEAWMPAVTGALFLPLFVLAVLGLSALPPPNAGDIAARTHREPMDRRARRAFVARFALGIAILVVVYLFLTAYRDIRDNYAAELWQGLDYGDQPAAFTRSELPIALVVMLVLSLLSLIKDNRRGLIATYAIMIAGCVLVGLGTLLFDLGVVGGMGWMVMVGLGLYLGYVPYGCVLFDRTVAAVGVVATAVFLIYVSDAVAYSGTVGVVLYRRLAAPELSMVDFFRWLSYFTSATTTVLFVVAGIYFLRRAKKPDRQQSPSLPG